MSGPLIRRAIGLYAAGAVLLLIGAFPLLWMLSTALKPSGEIFATPPTLVPVHPTATNFTRLMAETNFVLFFQNSLAISLTTVLLTLTVSALGAYGLTRYTFAGREKVAGLILLTYMFAPIMIIIPFYILVKQLGIANTRLALVLSYTTFCLPFCLWLLRAFFQSIPLELEEAALVDGAHRGKAVWYVVLPLALPGLIAAGIFTFILAWNDFLFALVMSVQWARPVTYILAGTGGTQLMMVRVLLAMLPPVVLALFVQRYLVRALTLGAVR